MTKIILPAILSSYRPKVDKSWSVSLNLNEPNGEQKVIIDELHQKAVFVLIKDAEIFQDEEELMDNIDADITSKTPSQRLRSVLYLLWKDRYTLDGEFKDFYRQKMETIISHFKDKLD